MGKPIRQYIETVFSKLAYLFSRKIHAVSPRGFKLKIVCFLLVLFRYMPSLMRLLSPGIWCGGRT